MAAGRIKREKAVIETMIHMFCRGNRHEAPVCHKCAELIAYSHARLDACRFKDAKPFCSKCPVHCYRNDMRQAVREVMRYSGPRMLLVNPLMAIRHLFESRLE